MGREVPTPAALSSNPVLDDFFLLWSDKRIAPKQNPDVRRLRCRSIGADVDQEDKGEKRKQIEGEGGGRSSG